MPNIPNWREVESKVHSPGLWVLFLVGTVFLFVGVAGLLAIGFVGVAGVLKIGDALPLGIQRWLGFSFMGIFASIGGVLLAVAIKKIVLPTCVRHAAADVLPNVPREPVIQEGLIVHGRLTHELCENNQGWEFRPAENVRRNDKRFLLGFGIPFLMLFAGLLTWVFHSQLEIAGWVVSAICGTFITMLCGGTVVLLIGMIMRAGYRKLSKLTIPRDGNDLELELAEMPECDKADLAKDMKWLFHGEAKRHRLSISRELLVAVQLCPWKYVRRDSRGTSTTWAVQGLLVLSSPDKTIYHRLPVLLTGDFAKAAKLMQRLAHTLQVPYLFCADAAEWKVEAIRAKKRPPLKSGGHQS